MVLKAEVAADIRAIFNAASRHGAEALLAAMVEKYEKRASQLATWMEENILEGLYDEIEEVTPISKPDFDKVWNAHLKQRADS